MSSTSPAPASWPSPPGPRPPAPPVPVGYQQADPGEAAPGEVPPPPGPPPSNLVVLGGIAPAPKAPPPGNVPGNPSSPEVAFAVVQQAAQQGFQPGPLLSQAAGTFAAAQCSAQEAALQQQQDAIVAAPGGGQMELLVPQEEVPGWIQAGGQPDYSWWNTKAPQPAVPGQQQLPPAVPGQQRPASPPPCASVQQPAGQQELQPSGGQQLAQPVPGQLVPGQYAKDASGQKLLVKAPPGHLRASHPANQQQQLAQQQPPPAPPGPPPAGAAFVPGFGPASAAASEPDEEVASTVPWSVIEGAPGVGLKPVLDDGTLASSALARLEQLQDPQFERLKNEAEAIMSLACTKQWAHLKDTFDLQDWVPLLTRAGADHGNITSLVELAQQGVAGRVEANRLLWTWCHPQSSSKVPYENKVQVYQASIRKARQSLDMPPKTHQDWGAWVPGRALGPYWEPHRVWIPDWADGKQWVGPAPEAPGTISMEEHKRLVDKAVAEAKAGFLSLAEVEEEKRKAVSLAMEKVDIPKLLNHWKPQYLLTKEYENVPGKWSMGWYFDERRQGQWIWWTGTEAIYGARP